MVPTHSIVSSALSRPLHHICPHSHALCGELFPKTLAPRREFIKETRGARINVLHLLAIRWPAPGCNLWSQARASKRIRLHHNPSMTEMTATVNRPPPAVPRPFEIEIYNAGR